MAARSDLWKLVEDRREGVLATLGPAGAPHLSNIYYLADASERVVLVSTTADRAKGRNLLRDTRAALYVPGDDFFNFAVAEGEVSVTLASVPGQTAIDELYRVHSASRGRRERPAFDHRMIKERRMIVRLQATRLYGLIHG